MEKAYPLTESPIVAFVGPTSSDVNPCLCPQGLLRINFKSLSLSLSLAVQSWLHHCQLLCTDTCLPLLNNWFILWFIIRPLYIVTGLPSDVAPALKQFPTGCFVFMNNARYIAHPKSHEIEMRSVVDEDYCRRPDEITSQNAVIYTRFQHGAGECGRSIGVQHPKGCVGASAQRDHPSHIGDLETWSSNSQMLQFCMPNPAT